MAFLFERSFINKRSIITDMDEITSLLNRIQVSPSYDSFEDPMSELIKDLKEYCLDEESIIHKLSSSCDPRKILRYYPGSYQKLIHHVAAEGNNILLSFIVSLSIASMDYTMLQYINSSNDKQVTPLQLAKRNGKTETVKLLLSFGAVDNKHDIFVQCHLCQKSFCFKTCRGDKISKSKIRLTKYCKKCKNKRQKKAKALKSKKTACKDVSTNKKGFKSQHSRKVTVVRASKLVNTQQAEKKENNNKKSSLCFL